MGAKSFFTVFLSLPLEFMSLKIKYCEADQVPSILNKIGLFRLRLNTQEFMKSKGVSTEYIILSDPLLFQLGLDQDHFCQGY